MYMRILLRNKSNGLYWESPDKWTANPELAFDFRFIERARACADSCRLKEVELAFMWDSPLAIQCQPLFREAMEIAA